MPQGTFESMIFLLDDGGICDRSMEGSSSKLAYKKNDEDDAGSTISTLLHDRINPKDCQVLSLGDTGFLQLFRVVSRDYGKPRDEDDLHVFFWKARL